MAIAKLKVTRYDLDLDNVSTIMKHTEKNRPCVYIMYNGYNEQIRGGITENLAYRLQSYKLKHRKYYTETIDEVKYIEIYEIPSLLHVKEELMKQLRDVEKVMLAIIQPKYNIDVNIVGNRRVPLTEAKPFNYR